LVTGKTKIEELPSLEVFDPSRHILEKETEAIYYGVPYPDQQPDKIITYFKNLYAVLMSPRLLTRDWKIVGR
jgi:hypothetical protein